MARQNAVEVLLVISVGAYLWIIPQTHGAVNNVGARVFARWNADGRYYKGVIDSRTAGTFHIQFDDGRQISHFKTDSRAIVMDVVPPVWAVTVESEVIAWWPNRVRYYSGRVHNITGDRYYIKYNDGDKGWARIDQIRVYDLARPSAKILQGNVTLLIGGELKLDCTAVGDPKPQVKWKKDGFSEIPRAILESYDNTTLVIDSVTPEDEGQYECEVQNIMGTGYVRSWVAIYDKIAKTVGARVFARWNADGRYYKGSIDSRPADTFHIQFDDGRQISHYKTDSRAIVMDVVPPVWAVTVESEVIAWWPNRVRYYPGRVHNITSDRYYIKYDDGDKGWARIDQIRVYDLARPSAKILQGNVTLLIGGELKLDCTAVGDPKPQVKWKKDGFSEIPRAIIESYDNTTLVIDSVTPEDEGQYECEVQNIMGTGYVRSWVAIYDKTAKTGFLSDGINWDMIWPLFLISFVVVCALLFSAWLLRRRRTQVANSTNDNLPEPHPLGLVSRRRRPSDPWEVLEEDVYIEGFLGFGAFGEVWRAVVQHVGQIKGNRECAVKKLRENVSNENRRKFMKEIELGKLLGTDGHPNIVRFLGCVTRTDNLMIVMEYTPHGDLLAFMRKSRGVDDSHCIYKEQLHVRKLTNYELVNFAQQVACGMQFLNSKGIMHRDLAARNVLVSSDFVCKVTDFGMALQSDKYGYGAAKGGRIPIKWAAPEVLFETSIFPVSSNSDVWSYGILLYEIFTLGGNPYDGLREADVIARLQNNQYRMPKPEHVSDEIYSIMMHCWNEDPSRRPSFEELRETFLGMISEEHYLELFDDTRYNSNLYQPEILLSENHVPAELVNSPHARNAAVANTLQANEPERLVDKDLLVRLRIPPETESFPSLNDLRAHLSKSEPAEANRRDSESNFDADYVSQEAGPNKIASDYSHVTTDFETQM